MSDHQVSQNNTDALRICQMNVFCTRMFTLLSAMTVQIGDQFFYLYQLVKNTHRYALNSFHQLLVVFTVPHFDRDLILPNNQAKLWRFCFRP
ncbi:MAG: hypothetical protein ACK5JT_17160 [Hyphomicrobiaceae bacterium]